MGADSLDLARPLKPPEWLPGEGIQEKLEAVALHRMNMHLVLHARPLGRRSKIIRIAGSPYGFKKGTLEHSAPMLLNPTKRSYK